VKRPRQIDGMSVEEFIARNADDLWYHQNEMWEMISPDSELASSDDNATTISSKTNDDDCPF